MNLTTKILGISMLTLLSACYAPNEGYYDSNGNYHSTLVSNKPHAPLPGGYDVVTGRNDFPEEDVHQYYRRAGYYDYNGYYIAYNNGPAVPRDMLPPRGMCRVWFIEREVADQPGVESCVGIRNRVPAGAYVIYGG